MRKSRRALAVTSAFPLVIGGSMSGFAQNSDSNKAPVKALGVVTTTGVQPTSLPTQIPTAIEGVTRDQIEHSINYPIKKGNQNAFKNYEKDSCLRFANKRYRPFCACIGARGA